MQNDSTTGTWEITPRGVLHLRQAAQPQPSDEHPDDNTAQ